MIEPRCWIEGYCRSRLLLDDFAVGENGFIGPPPGPDALAQIDRHHKLAAAGLASGLPGVMGRLLPPQSAAGKCRTANSI
jgi:hypothetical protein